ncbi:MAG: universal stress protein [Acidobacteria bacterium]|nr:universal stress protein [Acidobacteriota bacterium]
MKLLIADDGSDCAKAALDDLRRAGLPKKAQAIVVSVADVWIPITEKYLNPFEEAAAIAQQAGARVRSYFPDWEVSSEALSGSPARAIIEKADAWQPDLIIVGSHGRSALGQLLLGSVSQKIATEANCSVHIARPKLLSETLPVRILLAFDGSLDANEAVQRIAERLWPSKSEIRVIAVLPPRLSTTPLLPWTPEQIKTREADARKWMEGQVAAAVESLQISGCVVSTVITEGNPMRVLLDEASGWGADCIFIGARGHHRLERFLLGSVATALISRAPCTVEIVRAGQTVYLNQNVPSAFHRGIVEPSTTTPA